VGVLCHTSTLIGIKENVVNVEGSSNKRLVVRSGVLLVSATVGDTGYRPKTFIKRTELNVNLDLVILKCDKRKGKTRVAAEPELKRDIESGFRESFARGTDSVRNTISGAGSSNLSKIRVS